MLERAGARKLLAVHKAATGSLKHCKEAAAAVARATVCLDKHHGSASGLMPESWRDVALRLMSDDDQSWTQVKSKGKGNDWSGKGGNWGGWENQSKGKGKGKGKAPAEWPKSGKGKGKESGKGKGKDDGKSKGKGKGPCWPCPNKKCAILMQKVWMNAQSLHQCGQCGTHKETSWDPNADWQARREELRAEVAAESGSGAAADKEAEAPKPKAAAAQVESEGVEEMDLTSEDDQEEEEDIIWLTDEYKDLESKLFAPKPMKEGWTPEQELLGGKDAAGKAAEQRAQEIAACKKLLELEPMAVALKGSKVDFAATRAQLEALEKAAVKADKHAPTAALTVCQLAERRQDFIDEEDKKIKIAATGAEKAGVAQERMEQICAEQAQAWMDQMRVSQKAKKLRDAAWELRAVEHETRRTRCLELIDQRIEAAKKLALAIAATKKASPARTKAEEVAEKQEKLKAEKAEAEKQQTERKKAEEDAKAAAKEKAAATIAFRQLEFNTKVKTEDLPDLTKAEAPAEEVLVTLSRMHYWAKATAIGDAHLPFAFSEMGATATVARLLAGEKVWTAFFAATEIQDNVVCPMQLRRIIFLQLMTYSDTLSYRKQANEALEKQEEEAKQSLEEAEPRLKKLRTLIRPRSELDA